MFFSLMVRVCMCLCGFQMAGKKTDCSCGGWNPWWSGELFAGSDGCSGLRWPVAEFSDALGSFDYPLKGFPVWGCAAVIADCDAAGQKALGKFSRAGRVDWVWDGYYLKMCSKRWLESFLSFIMLHYNDIPNTRVSNVCLCSVHIII